MSPCSAARTSSSRLTLTQAFNSAGTTVGPWLGANVILAGALGGAAVGSARDVQAVQGLYIALAATLFIIAVAFSLFKLPVVPGTDATTSAANDPNAKKSVWEHSHLVLGAVAIFMYVGAEVSIASWAVNFMQLPEVAGLDSHAAGEYLIFYWGGAMVGRFIGALVLRFVKPGYVLACNATVAIALLVIAISSGGKLAMWSVLAIGLFNSIMFPTIFTLALARLGRHTGEGSGILCVAIVGGALVPMLQAAFRRQPGVAGLVLRARHLLRLHRVLRFEGHVVRSVPDAEISAGRRGPICDTASQGETGNRLISVAGSVLSVRDSRREENPARETHDGWHWQRVAGRTHQRGFIDGALPMLVKRAVVAQAVLILAALWSYATWRVYSDKAETLESAPA